MRWFFSIAFFIVIAFLLYLLIRWFQSEADKLTNEKHKPEKLFKMRAVK